MRDDLTICGAADSDPLATALNNALASNDQAAMIALYTEVGDRLEAAGDVDAACFYLTNAYVHALELGSAELDGLHRRLHRHGRVPA